MLISLPKLGEPIIYSYGYDQLNCLIVMDAYKGLNTGGADWTPIAIDDYKERYRYDPNGNILTLFRNGTTASGNPLAMDQLTYNYKAGTNQLDHVND